MPVQISEKYLKLMRVKNQRLQTEFVDVIADANLSIDAFVASCLKEDRGVFFTHQHGHLGSYKALIDLIPLFKKQGVKYFLIEQPQEYQNLFDDPELLRAQINPNLNSEQKAYWQIYAKFIATLKANDIKIIAVAPGFSKDGIGEIITTREEQLVRNIQKTITGLKDKSAKFVGLFGHWHVAMAAQLNVKAIALKNVGANNGEWQIRPWSMTAADLVPGGLTLSEVRAQFPQEFNQFITEIFYNGFFCPK